MIEFGAYDPPGGPSTSTITDVEAFLASQQPVANGYGGSTKEKIPDEQWAGMWDNGTIYNGGGAFNNTMTGYYFEWVPVTSGASLMSVVGSDADTNAVDPPTEVGEIIVTGARIGTEFNLVRMIARMTPGTGDDFAFAVGNALTRPGPHTYVVMDQVGDSECDVDEAWAALQQFAAPGQFTPAVNGAHVNLPGFGPIQQFVDPVAMKVTNVTDPGHMLYPGTVERSVVVQGGKVFIQTVGSGTGNMAGANVLGSPVLWGALDAAIAISVDLNDNGPGDC